MTAAATIEKPPAHRPRPAALPWFATRLAGCAMQPPLALLSE